MAHYLITGHTGFKGSWLTLLLKSRGHEVSGLALEPPADSLFSRANIASDMVHDLRVDIRNRNATVEAFKQVAPDYVIHLAAQALVREGYRKPVETYETNVNGTMHVLEASDQTGSIQAQLIITTDKVYRNDGRSRPYVESDPLGGKDPYSASKAMADILTQEWLGAGRSKPGAIARAGNVIGAGDTAQDRLIPDIIRSVQSGNPLHVRYPQAVRPWQHVLDCLSGYIDLVNWVGPDTTGATFNFGPTLVGASTVIDAVKKASHFLPSLSFEIDRNNQNMPEEPFLTLDSTRSREFLGWSDFIAADAIELSLEGALPGIPIRVVMERQILAFLSNMKIASSEAERSDTKK
jgi:CDP-glucose 4,6-dehydratase